ncbi:hypothetical protein LCGC14_0831530 [marine sediment metagenome]|uniref:Uncharacterized protein n=1 Tax=marine sediment metagenome TaxID=412755 RepID=A0A0F9PKH0_9ZZZZ|nr:hypothetical protein [bacterium]
MYKMNEERAVLALWDEDLKRDLHEAYYAFIPEMRKFISNPKLIFETATRPPKRKSPMLYEILSKWILDLEEPDPFELSAFAIRHQEILTDRLQRILDKDEIMVQIKRRRLLG